MKIDDKEEASQLLRLAQEYMKTLYDVLEITSGSRTDQWRIDDWLRRQSKLDKTLQADIMDHYRADARRTRRKP